MLLGITAVIFITGPHIYFEEVRYFLAIVLASHINKDIKNSYAYLLFLVGASLSLSLPKQELKGFWGLEGTKDNQFLWTSSKARFSVCSNEPIKIRTFNVPMKLNILFGNKLEQIELKDTKWKSIGIRDKNTRDIFLLPDFVWSPEGDSRWLGVMLKSDFKACES